MPLYFFHLRDGEDTLIDGEGLELGGIEAAKATALLQAREIISHDALEGAINLAQRIDVLDEAGAIICSMGFEDAVHVRR
ncbi:hypothetical protein GCM10022276_28600 [Sphingomonas limnosediminicola]|jgi:hypothetical protein|uniref:DUF6894 domain-containing protein n=1 Tax=Sphingomonas limnosediminicola TaxID=940133 RepID=A0ABP7LW86_9SPHN